MSEPAWTVETLKALLDERVAALKNLVDERFQFLDEARKLQAGKYEDRLRDLNHSHDKALEVQHTYVTQDKFETHNKTDKLAVELALNRVNEKFEDYIKRYEARQREIDLALAVQKGAADTAQRMVEEQGRKFNRNLGIATFLLAMLVAAANYFGS